MAPNDELISRCMEETDSLGRLLEKRRDYYFLRYKSDPTYGTKVLDHLNINNGDVVLLLFIAPIVGAARVTRFLYRIHKASREAPLAIEAGFPTDTNEAFHFFRTTRWNSNVNKCYALELMLLDPYRITHFAAWKASQIEKKGHIGNLVDEFNHEYRKKFFLGGGTYRDG